MKIMVPFLLEKGVLSEATEVRAVMQQLLFKITRQSGFLLKPYVPDIVLKLLDHLSLMEPQVLNYLAFHVEKMGYSQEQLETSRLAATRNSPMMTSIEACLDQVDENILEELVPGLLQVIRRGVGLPTRAGVARVLSSLSLKFPSQLKLHAPNLVKGSLSAQKKREEKKKGGRHSESNSA